MKKAMLLLPLVFCSTLYAQRPTPNASNDWQLIWSDEFNGKALDATKWNVLTREQSKHDELQYYVPDEVYVENGHLRIRSRVRDYGNMKYTSGRLDTSGKFSPVYGRYEIRGKMPNGKGMWPAYWLYPQNRDYAMEYLMSKAVEEGKERYIPEYRPWYSEIDIMEFLGHEPTIMYGTSHYQTFKGERKSVSGKWTGDVDFTKDYHIFTLDWEPDSMRWYIDGKLYYKTVTGIPHTPHYLIINTAIGGGWPGTPDSTTVFPQFHDVDYVRVYQRPSMKQRPHQSK
jgi:beta-glucanase (GH16 family)